MAVAPLMFLCYASFSLRPVVGLVGRRWRVLPLINAILIVALVEVMVVYTLVVGLAIAVSNKLIGEALDEQRRLAEVPFKGCNLIFSAKRQGAPWRFCLVGRAWYNWGVSKPGWPARRA